jgi:pyruvate dehydrogenase E2 component (dihydrolipoamide acetyltransferase)
VIVRAALLSLAILASGACLTPGTHAQKAPELAGDPGAASPESMVQVRDAWLRVHKEGAGGTPVVFVHGYGSRLEAWRAVQPRIAAARATFSLDLRGFGKSERPAATADAGYGVHAHADDLLALLEAEGIERAVLVGHSYGASVVLHAALAAPERVAGIVLVSPFVLEAQKNAFLRWAELPVMGEWLYATTFRDFAGEKMLLPFAEPQQHATLEALDEIERNQAQEGTTYAALATVRGMDFEEARYPSLGAERQTPITIVWGEQDRVTPIRHAPDVAAALGNPTFVRVPAAGHMPPWERPDAVVEAIEALVARAETAAATGAAP